MIGEKFFRLRIIEAAPSSPKEGPRWKCECDCGNSIQIPYYRLKTGHTKSCGCLATDLHKNTRIVNEIGIYDPGRANRHAAPHLERLYILWRNILYRATERRQAKKQSCEGVTVSDGFRHFSDFVDWCMAQAGWNQGFELDKDLLTKGNREYAAEKCVFLPPELNILLTNRARWRGDYPVGVNKVAKSGRFAAGISINGRSKHLGTYDTPQDAFVAYKTCKEGHMKALAEQYKEQIDPRAYKALIARRVEITD